MNKWFQCFSCKKEVRVATRSKFYLIRNDEEYESEEGGYLCKQCCYDFMKELEDGLS